MVETNSIYHFLVGSSNWNMCFVFPDQIWKSLLLFDMCIHENGRACRASDVYTGKTCRSQEDGRQVWKATRKNKSHALGRSNIAAKMQPACEYMWKPFHMSEPWRLETLSSMPRPFQNAVAKIYSLKIDLQISSHRPPRPCLYRLWQKEKGGLGDQKRWGAMS